MKRKGTKFDLLGPTERIWKATEVFVPGGMPSVTYVDRTGRDLENRLRAVQDSLCKLVTVTGLTKSGKTVLANRVFPRNSGSCVWVDGGTVKSEDDLWTGILGEIEGATEIESTTSTDFGGSLSAGAHGQAGIPLVAKGAVKAGGAVSASRRSAAKRTLTKTPRAAAISELRRTKLPLVVDDFHYLDRELQGSIVRALKPLIFDGQPIVFIAIPHRRYDVVRVEREMTGRLEAIDVPSWSEEELIEIGEIGFPLLNVALRHDLAHQMAKEAYGSPHLMQEFCRQLAAEHGVRETLQNKKRIDQIPEGMFERISSQMGRIIFDKLKKGPRQRSDRKPRPLVEGGTADVYEAVLRGLAALSPGLQRVNYEELRNALRSVLADHVPQAHEVSRVLEKMSEIASSDEASTPVIDWDKEERELHITDPFFAFFLKWGLNSGH